MRLICASSAGSATDLGTSACAAWWLTISGLKAAIAASTALASRTSSRWSWAAGFTLAALPVLKLSMTAT